MKKTAAMNSPKKNAVFVKNSCINPFIVAFIPINNMIIRKTLSINEKIILFL